MFGPANAGHGIYFIQSARPHYVPEGPQLDPNVLELYRVRKTVREK
jgi:hypothetical protein